MKASESNNLTLLKTINECRRAGREHTLGHSKGKPDVSSMTTNIDVRFATPLPMEIEIRRLNEPPGRKPGPLSVPVHLAAWMAATTNGDL